MVGLVALHDGIEGVRSVVLQELLCRILRVLRAFFVSL